MHALESELEEARQRLVKVDPPPPTREINAAIDEVMSELQWTPPADRAAAAAPPAAPPEGGVSARPPVWTPAAWMASLDLGNVAGKAVLQHLRRSARLRSGSGAADEKQSEGDESSDEEGEGEAEGGAEAEEMHALELAFLLKLGQQPDETLVLALLRE